MTADDFVRWQHRRRGADPKLFLRDCERDAPLLCRFDRARLPGGRDQRTASFVIVDVPERDRSVFFSTPHASLVTTGDPDHIVFLRLKLGYPASALWQYDRYRAAHDEIARGGRVAQDIFPNFPHDLWRSWTGAPGASIRRRPRRPGRKSRS